MASQTAVTQWVLDHPLPVALVGALLTVRLLTSVFYPAKKSTIPHLPETIPILSNTYQYMTDMTTFLARCRTHLTAQTPIFQFRLGPEKIYMLTTARNIQALFRTSPAISPDKFLCLVYEHVAGFPEKDMNRIKADKTGRMRTPAGATKEGDDGSGLDRYFYPMHVIVHEHLVQAHKTDALALRFQSLFEDRLAKRFPLTTDTGESEWITALVYNDLLLSDTTSAATGTLAGTRILQTEPDLPNLLWEMDEGAAKLVWGLPKWMNRSIWRKRDALLAACRRHVEREWEGFDWEGEESKKDWEEVWGASVTRESLRWLKREGWEVGSLAGTLAVMYIFGSNANTTPVVGWCLIEILRSPTLFQTVRSEVAKAIVTDPVTSTRHIDIQKLLASPLLQSIYVEAMRLHVSMNITREVMEPIQVGGHELEKGSLIQAPTEVSHLDEGIWGAEGHPAGEFWAERHVKYVERVGEDGRTEKVPQFSMTGRASDWYPYGGGPSMCPGRFFAKQEIILTFSILVSRFDIEFVGWTHKDGSPSDRGPQNDVRWSGAASVPPDRDMKVRWKRVW
ncbi:putative cytochrome P450 E-class, group IV [Dichotomopilus funicola]|uniref:Cytochrome P450 E-class, group IV n=1 Tax=Dichotomopilus funicola TaxID=1934379 RepID=A0AAN6UXP3_9PEZI|nr:putative cytochrome P450 E-class, group IV [Dichotomopilus funicola]